MVIAAASPSVDHRAALLMFGAVVAAVITLYLLPSLVAAVRGAPDLGSIVAVNVLLGWSLIGWVLALALALRDRPDRAVVGASVSPAGWYPDPELPSRLRYWTGSVWSDALAQPFAR